LRKKCNGGNRRGNEGGREGKGRRGRNEEE